MFSTYDLSKPRTFSQWLAAAKKGTVDVRTDGSPSPLVWVLVEGRNIPENAIVGGKEKRKPLYIARSFYEGGIHIGKAGRHLPSGAVIPYNGHEIPVDTFEVLVPAAPQPTRYTITYETTEVVEVETDYPLELRYLKQIETVILVDDSASMEGALWADAREALAGIADLAAKYDSDGVDVYFLNDSRSATNLTNGSDVRRLFNSITPRGQTPTGNALEKLFNKYIPRLENSRLSHKPITIVVITDGEPTDDCQKAIIDGARRLDDSQIPEKKFSVQFVQIGDDEDATEGLRELDEGISDVHGVRDIVDVTPFHPGDGQFTTATVVKILLGTINGLVDTFPTPVLRSPATPRPSNVCY
jgi:uncharacterized protein YegL